MKGSPRQVRRILPTWYAATLLAGCGSTGTPANEVAAQANVKLPVEIPAQPKRQLLQPHVVASKLINPRGLLRLSDGSLLVAEAGRGDPAEVKTGRVLRLVDRNSDGDSDDDGERSVLLDAQASVNILGRLAVNRDEVFGLADLEEGGGMQLATIADPVEGTVVVRLDDQIGKRFTTTRDNANSIVFHPGLKKWFAVQSFANTVIEIGPGGAERVAAQIDALEQGQHSVPAAITYEPATGALLVALFSGQLGGDTAGSGVDFVRRSGRVVRLNPSTGKQETVVSGLNAPTDIAVRDGLLYIVEFCSDFRDPVRTPEQARAQVTHAGFVRFSGRVVRVSLTSGEVIVIAEKLDLPTHIRVEAADRILVTEGQGTPGRMLPGPTGPTPLEGRLIRFGG